MAPRKNFLSLFKWNISFKLSILLVFFSVSSWVAIDSMFIELPILVKNLPEEWSLPSYLGVTTQMGNVGCILYMIFYKYQKKRINDVVVISVTIGLMCVLTFLLIFTWSYTVNILNGQYSLALLILSFLLSSLSCTSTVTFFPYMARFKAEYLSVFYFGLGMSGLFPSFISMIQGAGGEEPISCVNKNSSVRNFNMTTIDPTTDDLLISEAVKPLFGVEVFFSLITLLIVIGLLSFIGLNKFNFCKKYMLHDKPTSEAETKCDLKELCSSDQKVILACRTNSFSNVDDSGLPSKDIVPKSDDAEVAFIEKSENQGKQTKEEKALSRAWYITFMVLLSWMTALVFGMIPALLSYASLPYGTSTYHIATVIGRGLEPLSYVLYHFLPTKSPKLILTLTGIATVAGGYIAMIAAMSPCPLLTSSPVGGILVILSAIIAGNVTAYCLLAISTLLHQKGKEAMMWSGVAIQVGTGASSLFMGLLVNIGGLFTQADPCKPCLL